MPGRMRGGRLLDPAAAAVPALGGGRGGGVPVGCWPAAAEPAAASLARLTAARHDSSASARPTPTRLCAH